MSFRLSDRDEEDGNAPDLKSDELAALRLLTERENKAVQYSRYFVIGLLAIASITFSLSAYKVTAADQIERFKASFESYAGDLIDIFHKSIDRQVLEAVESLSISITSHALESNATFPFVSLDSYHVLAANARVLSGAMTLNFSPLVSDRDLPQWNKYAAEHRSAYIDAIEAEMEQLEVQDASFAENGRRVLSITEDDLPSVVIDLDVAKGSSKPAAPGTGPYLVSWLVSPAVPFSGGFNFNLFSHPAGSAAFKEAVASGRAVLGRADSLTTEDYGATADYVRLILSSSQYRDTVDAFANDPSSSLAYPVFDSFDTKTRQVVGLISSTIYWRLYFSDILPSTAKGIVCVLKNNFNQTFTYQVDGRTAVYLGDGDRHDPKFDELAQTTELNQFVADLATKRTRSYTHVGLSDFSQYTFSVYPSDATMTPFTNAEPTINTIVIVGVFVFVSLVFFAYDAFVRRQKNTLVARAVASGAIVSSLFPSAVRDKLYENEEETAKKSGMVDYAAMQGDDVRQGGSIAELFESTTIMFADLAGFTKWSSKRTPEEVFLLLETLYQAFDEIAVRRKVFKVETVGDCYVAVAGLPEPQEKNAVIMVKFATACMEKMREVVGNLALTLGADTAELDFRVGLHSGPVTGGVLRGQRSRFQLFGPTMNQASRMESTGVPGRIHVSKETANELRKHGKETWLQNRLDKVEAKGLGTIETFWAVAAAP